MTQEEINRYFDTTPPPLEVDWKPWAKISDTQLFLRSCYSGIHNYNGPLDMCPAWWHLKEFYILIKRSSQQNSSEAKTE